ncbi:MAG: hypothetical protein ACJAWV_001150 [Flammeovirgaceae bacterium]|jgi:hypothetical protein
MLNMSQYKFYRVGFGRVCELANIILFATSGCIRN